MSAFGGALEPSAGVADLLGSVALQKESVNIVRRVLHAVLIQYHGVPRKAHGGETIVLRNHEIAGLNQIDQCEIHAVRTLGEGQRLCAAAFKDMGGVAQQQAFCFVRRCQRNGAVHHRAAVRVHQNSHRFIHSCKFSRKRQACSPSICT
ncbi:hypothetical protein SDC9_134206 [bioreactor metagenome]|uniref:Uncharacterized protein n=1 Tax=bioreactor metagenome TaxID=1076179 RepID=A0A645DE40_9ZZZZ